MRLNRKQQEIIRKTAIRHFGENVVVFLFGSRVFEAEKGGDIDLLLDNVPDKSQTLEKKINFLVDLKKQLGDQRIDVIYKNWSDPKSGFQKSIEKTKLPV